MVKRKLTGWSTRGRPFSPKEFNNSTIKSGFNGSYGNYLIDFGRQYKNKRLRKTLLKK